MGKKTKKELRELARQAGEALREVQKSENPYTWKHDVHGQDSRGEECNNCGGSGRTFCCQSFAYAVAESFDDRGKQLVTWSHVLPRFPASGMEMNYCPFCGREFGKVVKKDQPRELLAPEGGEL